MTNLRSDTMGRKRTTEEEEMSPYYDELAAAGIDLDSMACRAERIVEFMHENVVGMGNVAEVVQAALYVTAEAIHTCKDKEMEGTLFDAAVDFLRDTLTHMWQQDEQSRRETSEQSAKTRKCAKKYK